MVSSMVHSHNRKREKSTCTTVLRFMSCLWEWSLVTKPTSSYYSRWLLDPNTWILGGCWLSGISRLSFFVLGLCSDFQNIRRFCMESLSISLSPASLLKRKTQGLHMMACWVQGGEWCNTENISAGFQISERLATRYVILNGKAFDTTSLTLIATSPGPGPL